MPPHRTVSSFIPNTWKPTGSPGGPVAVLREYFRQKYAGRKSTLSSQCVAQRSISSSNTGTSFFLKVPIVFATERPERGRSLGAGATGITFGNSYRKTLDLALRLHPGTEQVFIVSGTLNHDKAVRTIVRDDLRATKPRWPSPTSPTSRQMN